MCAERYSHLPSAAHQLMFLELQVDLLLEFHQDLSDSASKTHPLHPQCTAYLNASQYIADILYKWGEEKVHVMHVTSFCALLTCMHVCATLLMVCVLKGELHRYVCVGR